MGKSATQLISIYKRLWAHFGPRHWWPADTPFEVVVGAILTQNTAWTNVERAIANLKKDRVLTPKKLYSLRPSRLASLIKPAGYYNVKTRRLKEFLHLVMEKYDGSLKGLFKKETLSLREELLGVKGIGPETADSIMLYAAGKPIFVVDTYTRRIFSRHRLVGPDISYGDLQAFFMKNLPRRPKLFNEYHALIVETGKRFCKKKPLCDMCPLKEKGIKIS
ncbi:MAG: endonuclease III domain-containing protein [Candidatus Omnitrophica bacterium]|nr:endonuclease III domain-containing protein [Candidatus Omnitrophota bacterium]